MHGAGLHILPRVVPPLQVLPANTQTTNDTQVSEAVDPAWQVAMCGCEKSQNIGPDGVGADCRPNDRFICLSQIGGRNVVSRGGMLRKLREDLSLLLKVREHGHAYRVLSEELPLAVHHPAVHEADVTLRDIEGAENML